MSSLQPLLIYCLIITLIYMTGWFIASVINRRNDLADVAWGPGAILLVLMVQLFNGNPGILSHLALGLTVIWGLRLAAHIWVRNQDKDEDFRYKDWRKAWGKWFFIRSYIQVFLLQGILLILVALPPLITTAYARETDVAVWAIAGVITWATGFIFETVSDFQLLKFKSQPDNQGKIMTKGLWRYSRHPNYFGEIIQWWGLWLILCASTLPQSYKLVGLVGPLTITTLILGVSGIPLLEKKYSKNPAYKKYAKRTNKLIPADPKKT